MNINEVMGSKSTNWEFLETWYGDISKSPTHADMYIAIGIMHIYQEAGLNIHDNWSREWLISSISTIVGGWEAYIE